MTAKLRCLAAKKKKLTYQDLLKEEEEKYTSLKKIKGKMKKKCHQITKYTGKRLPSII